MTIYVTTTGSKQKLDNNQLLQLLITLKNSGLHGLSCTQVQSENDHWDTIIYIDDQNFEFTCMQSIDKDPEIATNLFSHYFSGTPFKVAKVQLFASPPRQVVSFEQLIRQALSQKQPQEASLLLLLSLDRIRNQLQKQRFLSAQQKPVSEMQLDLGRPEDWGQQLAAEKFRHDHEKTLLDAYQQFSATNTQQVIKQAIQTISVPKPDAVAQKEVKEAEHVGVSVVFLPRHKMVFEEAEWCLQTLRDILSQQPNFQTGTRFNYDYNAVGAVTTFSITFIGLILEPTQYQFLLEDIQQGIYAAAIDTDCQVGSVTAAGKPTLEQQKVKASRLIQATQSFFNAGTTRSWKTHMQDANVQYTWVEDKGVADKFAGHLQQHGLHAYASSTQKGRHAVSVDLSKTTSATPRKT